MWQPITRYDPLTAVVFVPAKRKTEMWGVCDVFEIGQLNVLAGSFSVFSLTLWRSVAFPFLHLRHRSLFHCVFLMFCLWWLRYFSPHHCFAFIELVTVRCSSATPKGSSPESISSAMPSPDDNDLCCVCVPVIWYHRYLEGRSGRNQIWLWSRVQPFSSCFFTELLSICGCFVIWRDKDLLLTWIKWFIHWHTKQVTGTAYLQESWRRILFDVACTCLIHQHHIVALNSLLSSPSDPWHSLRRHNNKEFTRFAVKKKAKPVVTVSLWLFHV